MFCGACGAELRDGVKFCPACGASLQRAGKPREVNGGPGTGVGAGPATAGRAGWGAGPGAGANGGPAAGGKAGWGAGPATGANGGPATNPGVGAGSGAAWSARFSLARAASALAALAMLALGAVVVYTAVSEAPDVMNTFSGYETLSAVLGMASYLLVGTALALTGVLAAWRLGRRALAKARSDAARMHRVPAAGVALVVLFLVLGAAIWAGPSVIDALDLSRSVLLSAVEVILEAYGPVGPVCTIAAGTTLVVLVAADIATRSMRRTTP